MKYTTINNMIVRKVMAYFRDRGGATLLVSGIIPW